MLDSICTCWCKYPNENHTTRDGRSRCLEKYECIHDLEELKNSAGGIYYRKTRCRRNIVVGDTIKCKDVEEAERIKNELAEKGIETEYLYWKNRKKGLWLVVEKLG